MIVMMVVMLARRVGRGLRNGWRSVGALRHFQQGRAATCTIVVPLAVGGSASWTSLGAFGFGVHVHGRFGALLKRESLNCLKDGGFGRRVQFGIIHSVSEFPSGST